MESSDSGTAVASRSGQSRKRGCEKRSNARIGRKQKKTFCKQEIFVTDNEPQAEILSPSQWLAEIPVDWTTVPHKTELQLCQISSQPVTSVAPLVISRSVIVKSDYSWLLHVNSHPVDTHKIPTLMDVPPLLDPVLTAQLLHTVTSLVTCIGNPDPKFVALAKIKKNGQFLSKHKDVVAFLDSGFCVSLDGQEYVCTVRCSACHLLTSEIARCKECKAYRTTLTTMCYRLDKSKGKASTPKRKANLRFMNTPQRLKSLRDARQTIRMRDQKIIRMKKRLEAMTSTSGVQLEGDVVEVIEQVIKERSPEMESLPKSDFRKIFWDQQVAAMKCKKMQGMRWHPLFIRWSLNLSRVSPKAYEVLQESGIQLPSRRTLNDYTHWVSAKPGFNHEVDSFLKTESKVDELDEWQRFVVLIIDEMKIQEDLVFDKTGERLHGFVNLGDINTDLQKLERQSAEDTVPSANIATHMLTLMVRGIFFKLEFPYASFPTQGVTGQTLFWIMWQAVRRLQAINLKVILFVCDGAKPNRSFLKKLGQPEHTKNGIVYKTVNKFSPDRFIYLMSDVPHLVKTTRNCWYSSRVNGGARCMWNNGCHILWDHLQTLYETTQTDSGLYVGRRLTYEHVNLTSYSKMKVNLAAQVLSSSVSSAFKMLGDHEHSETAKFCSMFDRFFDCLNTRNASEGKKKRKPDLDPYRSVNDKRFEWLENGFLVYLDDWKKSVVERDGFSDKEKKRMSLSEETFYGLHMTVYSFVELAKYLLSQKEGLFLLSERLNQDPLESFFGQQRARGGRSDNPNARNFLYNSQAIRVQRSMAVGHGGNVRRRKLQWSTDMDDLSRPLKKRRC